MKATHTGYQHPRHLRVETGEARQRWNIGTGYFTETALCVAPSSADYNKLNRPNLPRHKLPASSKDHMAFRIARKALTD